MTQKWLVFAKDTPDSTMRWHLARNTDICGYFTGIPPNLQGKADEEKWKLPYLYTETVEVPNGEG
jgi:hypothetical protein